MSPNQGLAADVSCVFDRITADESESTLLDRQVGLTESFMPQEGLLPTDIKVIGDFLRGRQTCRGRSVSIRASKCPHASCVMEGGTVRKRCDRQETADRRRIWKLACMSSIGTRALTSSADSPLTASFTKSG